MSSEKEVLLSIKEDVSEILVSEEQIASNVKMIGFKISEEYHDKDLIIVGILKGGIVFLADLIRVLSIPVKVDFIRVSSYGESTKTSGAVDLSKDIEMDIAGKHILIVEDLIDTGTTLWRLKEHFLQKNPASIKFCTAFDKPSRRKIPFQPDFVGVELPDRFVVGYGLDFDERYRNLRHVAVLKQVEVE